MHFFFACKHFNAMRISFARQNENRVDINENWKWQKHIVEKQAIGGWTFFRKIESNGRIQNDRNWQFFVLSAKFTGLIKLLIGFFLF